MVSPSKKKDIKGRENVVYSESVKDKTAKKQSKPYKPLASKKFYLDLKNNATLLNLETKLKSLGAVVEQFLVKEVNYVVTDRKNTCSPSSNTASCSTPATPSPSPSPSVGVSSPLDGLGQKKIKSRTEAMLEKVRLQPQCVKVDPLDNARSWNIPIYSLQEILQRLKKLCDKEAKHCKSTGGLKVLRGHYLKLETGRRPEFRQFKEWPSINLDCGCGENPFRPTADKRVTRQATKDGTERLAGGYCEMCYVDYVDIKVHVVTPQHLHLANSAENYAQLDSLIQTKTVDNFITSQMCASVVGGTMRCLRSGSVESQSNSMGSRSSSISNTNGHTLPPRTRASTRLYEDAKPLEVQCNGSVNHNHLTRSVVKSDSALEYTGLTRRARTISASCPGTTDEYSQLSPTGSDKTHHLRSRKQMWLPNSLIGTTAEDALTATRLRPSRDYATAAEPLKSPSSKTALKSPNTSLTNISPEKKVLSYDKEDDEENYVSSSCPLSTVAKCNNIKVEPQEESDEEESEKSNEEGSKIVEVTQSKEKIKGNKKSTNRKSKTKKVHRELANLREKTKGKKVLKKRLSVEEKLIEDNKSYYKVEVLNSKLRSTGYYITQTQRELEMSRTNGNDNCESPNPAVPVKTERKPEEKEPVVVRFKKVRQTELSLLSDEAESFMFGEPRRDSSVSTETSEEEEEPLIKSESDHDKIVTTIKKEVLDESSIGSCSLSSSSASLRRKRKSPDESFLQDNVEYYKFECTGSRLRFSQNPSIDNKQAAEELSIKVETLNEIPKCDGSDSLTVKLDESNFQSEPEIKEEILIENNEVRPLYKDLVFSFESAPEHEPWYQTFKRQDACEEYYYPTYSTYPTVLLPYEYPNSLMKRIKIAATKEKVKKRKVKHTKLKQLVVDDKPRKSPRCHASTLAIMSSLKRRRPRDSPEKKTEPPAETLVCPSEVVHDEESKCSTTVDIPPLILSDSQPQMASSQELPDIKTDSKPDSVQYFQKDEPDLKKAEEDIDELFTNMACDSEQDLVAQILLALKKEVESPPSKDNRKGKAKAKTGKNNPSILSGDKLCLPVDPSILDEAVGGSVNTPGPLVDMMNLIDGYRSCSSMERADYEHMNPQAVDVLRVLTAESCNSSDCGGSSACDYSFLEEGKVCKKKKRKKRNMTGWPANQKRRLNKKGEELSITVLKRNCKVKGELELTRVLDGNESGTGSLTGEHDGTCIDSAIGGEVPDKEIMKKTNLPMSNESTGAQDLCENRLKSTPEVKKCSLISRTLSIESDVEVQSCYIKVDKMSDICVDSLSRHSRSSDSNQLTNSSSRRSTRKAKIIRRRSLRSCR